MILAALALALQTHLDPKLTAIDAYAAKARTEWGAPALAMLADAGTHRNPARSTVLVTFRLDGRGSPAALTVPGFPELRRHP